ncbi:hypothetical protein [Mycobacterium intracellulare]|uniref:hypothetical protein n=1 Tax=Mycobacterium intracellulare TaxID=1767 RepID=UPI00109ED5F6|nr:hypothetical protein [Mycobacterium intracellulare]
MSLDLSNLKAELDALLSDATSVVDAADKFADAASRYAYLIPGVGPEVSTIVKVLDELDKALHAAKNLLA